MKMIYDILQHVFTNKTLPYTKPFFEMLLTNDKNEQIWHWTQTVGPICIWYKVQLTSLETAYK